MPQVSLIICLAIDWFADYFGIHKSNLNIQNLFNQVFEESTAIKFNFAVEKFKFLGFLQYSMDNCLQIDVPSIAACHLYVPSRAGNTYTTKKEDDWLASWAFGNIVGTILKLTNDIQAIIFHRMPFKCHEKLLFTFSRATRQSAVRPISHFPYSLDAL